MTSESRHFLDSCVQPRLWQIALSTSAEAEEAAAAILEHITGASAVTYQKAGSPRCLVSVYRRATKKQCFAWRAALLAGLEVLKRQGLHPGGNCLKIRSVRSESWTESWKRHFPPFEIGDLLLVKPDWSKRRPRPGQAEVVLNPGLSFGTGQHATTQFCLEAIVFARSLLSGGQFPKNVRALNPWTGAQVGRAVPSAPPPKCRETGSRGALGTARPIPRSWGAFLDVGTGSGILAIAAAKLGYGPVVACDHDPQALKTARQNAARNGVKIRLRLEDLADMGGRSAAQYQLICANLSSEILMAHGPKLVSLLEAGGMLVLAGMLTKEYAAVKRRYERLGLRPVRQKQKAGWRSGLFRRPVL